MKSDRVTLIKSKVDRADFWSFFSKIAQIEKSFPGERSELFQILLRIRKVRFLLFREYGLRFFIAPLLQGGN